MLTTLSELTPSRQDHAEGRAAEMIAEWPEVLRKAGEKSCSSCIFANLKYLAQPYWEGVCRNPANVAKAGERISICPATICAEYEPNAAPASSSERSATA